MKFLNEIRIRWGWFWFKSWLLLIILLILAALGPILCSMNIKRADMRIPLLSETTRSALITISGILIIFVFIACLGFIKNYKIDIQRIKEFRNRNPEYIEKVNDLIAQTETSYKTKKAMQWIRKCNFLIMEKEELKRKKEQLEELKKEIGLLEIELGI